MKQPAVPPSAPDTALLEVRHLRVDFTPEHEPIFQAVKGISFSLQQGEILGIVGESGSGKSVAMLALMRLLSTGTQAHVQGELLFKSRQYGRVDLRTLEREKMRHIRGGEIGFVFQNALNAFNPVYTCGWQITEVLKLHKQLGAKAASLRALELLDEVGMSNPEKIFRSYPHELSGGQRQRAQIAMALAGTPRLLIADEPTTSLDVLVQQDILRLLNRLRQEYDMSVIFISHDLGLVGELADRVAVMQGGALVEQGNVWEVFAQPKHRYTQQLQACRPSLLPPPTEESLPYPTALLQVRQLSKYFGHKPWPWMSDTRHKAVDNISFDIYPGEVLGLVGRSGCGKTTLGRLLLGLLKPSSGSIRYQNRELTRLSSRQWRGLRTDIQLIFQDPYSSLNPMQRVGDSLLEVMRVHDIGNSELERKKEALLLLRAVKLQPEDFRKFPSEFSGGQLQRINIARALAVRPRFLVCDECVSALDVSVQASILALLQDLKDRFGLTYLFISHDLAVVQAIADRVMVMNRGRIEEIGPARQIYQQPQAPFTKALVTAIPTGDLDRMRTRLIEHKMDRLRRNEIPIR